MGKALIIAFVLVLLGSLPASAANAKIVTSGSRYSGAVALTFDDGWNRSACSSIARTLRAYGATGTFFINGNHIRKAPAKWRRILRKQQVGNHTRSHLDLTLQSSAVVRRQIRVDEAIHERYLGRAMLKVFRPPYGASDYVSSGNRPLAKAMSKKSGTKFAAKSCCASGASRSSSLQGLDGSDPSCVLKALCVPPGMV